MNAYPDTEGMAKISPNTHGALVVHVHGYCNIYIRMCTNGHQSVVKEESGFPMILVCRISDSCDPFVINQRASWNRDGRSINQHFSNNRKQLYFIIENLDSEM